jgi:hypothetical protein
MPADPSDLRRSVYLLLGAAAVAIAAAKVVGAESVVEPSRFKSTTPGGYGSEEKRAWPTERPEPTPAFSSNDKARWATVKALVDSGTYSIGTRTFNPTEPKTFTDAGIKTEPQYLSLDIVLKPPTDEEKAAGKPVTKPFFASKPPLFTTLLAGEYWVLKKAFGWEIDRDRWLVIPAILLTVNVIPFAVYLYLLARLIDTAGKTDFARLLAFTTAAVGTLLTTFAGSLNNHLPGAFCALFAAYPVLRAATEYRDMGPGGYAASGFFAGLTVTFEMPAAAFLAGLGIPLLVARPRKAVFYFLPAAAVPIAAFFLTNYIALGIWEPAYSKFGGPWYEFEGSYWARLKLPERPKGIDFADEPKSVYAFHVLVGHHGWFSLTPVWVIGLAGLVMLGVRSAPDVKKLFAGGKGSAWTPRLFAGMTLAVSAVVAGYYIATTNNYGGFTAGPRWLFWLIPLWVLAVPPAADRLAGSVAGRVLCAVLLGASVFAAFYPAWNPWRPPWILQLMEFTGHLRY